ncbi:hypothetical protein [Archaeoglobus fulgidus]
MRRLRRRRRERANDWLSR